MKSKLVLVAAICFGAAAAAEWPWTEEPQKPQRPRAQVYALEGLGALGGAACVAACGGAALAIGIAAGYDPSSSVSSFSGPMLIGVGVAAVSAAILPAAAGHGAAWVGEGFGEQGSTGWAIGGAYAGAVVSGLGLVGVPDPSGRNGWASIPLYVLCGLAIPTGAVVGYNLGAKREVPASGFGSRLEPPGVALTSVRLPDRSLEYGVKVQLAGLRF